VNSTLRPGELDLGEGTEAVTATADASAIALEVLKVPIVNTAMLGVLCRVQDLVPIETIMEAVEERFGGKLGALAGKMNAISARQAYDKTTVGTAKGRRVFTREKEWRPAWNEIPAGTALTAMTVDGVEVGPGSARTNITGRWRWSTPRYLKD